MHYVQVTQVEEGDSPSIAALGMNSNPESQQTSPDSSLMSQGQLQSVLHQYKDRFPDTLPDGLPPVRMLLTQFS